MPGLAWTMVLLVRYTVHGLHAMDGALFSRKRAKNAASAIMAKEDSPTQTMDIMQLNSITRPHSTHLQQLKTHCQNVWCKIDRTNTTCCLNIGVAGP